MPYLLSQAFSHDAVVCTDPRAAFNDRYTMVCNSVRYYCNDPVTSTISEVMELQNVELFF